MSVSHIEADQRVSAPNHHLRDSIDRGQVSGPDASRNPVEYYVNPVGIHSIIFSAAELGPSVNLHDTSC